MNQAFRKTSKFGLILLLLSLLNQVQAQSTSDEKYKAFKKEALNLYKNKDYKKAALTYEAAFKLQEPGKTDCYYAARSWALTGKKGRAFKYLSKTADKNFTNYEHLTTNKDFVSLHSDKRWLVITDKVKENKKDNDIKYAPIVQSLKLVVNEDQKYRKMLDSIYQKFGWQSVEFRNLNKTIHEKDSVNLKIVTHILDKNGWLGQEEIGGEGADALFLVIQHADLKTQEKYVPVMREAVHNGKAVPQYLAMLEDRVLIGQGKKQIYGSQVESDKTTQKPIFSPIEDEEHVNKRRESVGLPPIEEYAKMMGVEYKVSTIRE